MFRDLSPLPSSTKDLNYQFKFILVDDGSGDNSLNILLALQAKEPRLEVIKLSRNWGYQNAYNAGVDRSTAHALIFDGWRLRRSSRVDP
jgi:glycosyltransferase involved in cell wall biosynthesis